MAQVGDIEGKESGSLAFRPSDLSITASFAKIERGWRELDSSFVDSGQIAWLELTQDGLKKGIELRETTRSDRADLSGGMTKRTLKDQLLSDGALDDLDLKWVSNVAEEFVAHDDDAQLIRATVETLRELLKDELAVAGDVVKLEGGGYGIRPWDLRQMRPERESNESGQNLDGRSIRQR